MFNTQKAKIDAEYLIDTLYGCRDNEENKISEIVQVLKDYYEKGKDDGAENSS